MLSAQFDLQTNPNKQMQLQETFPNSSFPPDLSKQSKCPETLTVFSESKLLRSMSFKMLNKLNPIFSQINMQLESELQLNTRLYRAA